MKRVVAPTPWSHNRTALAVNSGPLSERRCSGTSVARWTMRSPRLLQQARALQHSEAFQ